MPDETENAYRVDTSLVLHIPHASWIIPHEVRMNLLPDDTTLARELVRMTDAWTDELVEGFGLPAVRVMAPVSRLVVDVERFAEDADEPMTAQGMGAVYERLSSGEPLRARDPMQREQLMERWYRPHHARLADAVDDALAVHGRCLIIDVHSFASVPLPHEPSQDACRPEICLGTDCYHSPWQDGAAALATCQDYGFWAALNHPFAGSIVPAKHWGKTPEVRSTMIEVRRDLYQDERTGKKLRRFEDIAARVCRLLEALVALANGPPDRAGT